MQFDSPHSTPSIQPSTSAFVPLMRHVDLSAHIDDTKARRLHREIQRVNR